MPTLREALSREYPELLISDLRASELEGRISAMYMTSGAPCSSKSNIFRDWPGPHEDVLRWYALRDGTAIGVQGADGTPERVVRLPFNRVRHLDWNRLRTFHLVHEAGSFTKAATMLHITQSAVSRQIAALEEDMGSDLFIRSNSGLVLTEMGESFIDTIDKMWETLDLGLAQLNELREEPSGPIVLTTTQAFGSAWLSSRISRFHQLYPNIDVKLLLSDVSELDLRRRDADCAIRFEAPTEPGLIRLPLAVFSYGIYGCRSYLAKHGIPQTVEDLDDHELIAYGSGDGEEPINDINWLLHVGMPSGAMRRPAVQVNSIYGIYRAVESGAGIASVPFYLSERSDKLIEVLKDVPRPSIPVFFVYPEELRPSKRISVIRDFIQEEVRSNWGGRVVPEE